MYSCWVDSRGAEDLSRGLGHEVAAGLIYVGLAGATRSGGSTSPNTLWGRIATMHLSVVAVPVADADTLDVLESEILSELDPPLNLAKVSKTSLRTQLSALRKRYTGGESGIHAGGVPGSEHGGRCRRARPLGAC